MVVEELNTKLQSMRDQEAKNAAKLAEHSALATRINELKNGEKDLNLKLNSSRNCLFELQEENAKVGDELCQLPLHNVDLVGTHDKEVRRAKRGTNC